MAFTTAAGTAFAPDQRVFDPNEVVPEALILSTSTSTIAIEGDRPVVQVPYVDVDTGVGFSPEGELITETEADTNTVTIATGKISVIGKVSREAYSQEGVPSLLANAFSSAVIKRANVAYLAQPAPTAPAITPPAGLLNQELTDGGSVAANLDAVIDAVAGVEEAYGAASHVLANPSAWASIAKLKAATGSNQSLIGAGTEEAARMLLSVPVLTSAAVPADTLLVIDKANILSSYGPLMTAVSEHTYFRSDSIALKVLWRFGAKIIDSQRVVKLTITDPA